MCLKGVDIRAGPYEAALRISQCYSVTLLLSRVKDGAQQAGFGGASFSGQDRSAAPASHLRIAISAFSLHRACGPLRSKQAMLCGACAAQHRRKAKGAQSNVVQSTNADSVMHRLNRRVSSVLGDLPMLCHLPLTKSNVSQRTASATLTVASITRVPDTDAVNTLRRGSLDLERLPSPTRAPCRRNSLSIPDNLKRRQSECIATSGMDAGAVQIKGQDCPNYKRKPDRLPRGGREARSDSIVEESLDQFAGPSAISTERDVQVRVTTSRRSSRTPFCSPRVSPHHDT